MLCSNKYGLLKSRLSMKNYIKEYKGSAFCSGNCMEYGFRVDTERFSYLLRYNPIRKEVMSSPENWRSFLKSACHNYRRPFDEQLLVYAQRSDATAVLGNGELEYKVWEMG